MKKYDNTKDYLTDLGYVYPDKDDSEILSNHLHSLKYDKYTFKINNHMFMVGIYNDFHIHFVVSLYQREGQYDMFSHDIPKAIPVDINDLILNPSIEKDLLESKDFVFKHLKKMGWRLSIPLKEKSTLEFTIKEYFIKINDIYYSVFVKTNDETYLIYSVKIVNMKYRKEEELLNNTLPCPKDLIELKIQNLLAAKDSITY